MPFTIEVRVLSIDYSITSSWYVDGQKPVLRQLFQHLNIPKKNEPFITSLYADGEELESIHTKFKNLPQRRFELPTIWRGELAQFIYDNL